LPYCLDNQYTAESTSGIGLKAPLGTMNFMVATLRICTATESTP
jgi:hypothetical protein